MEKHGALRYGSTKVWRNYEDPDELCFVVVCLFLYTGPSSTIVVANE